MNTNAGKKRTISIIIALASLLFSYAIYKAWALSITWDEAFSYLEYVRFKVWGFDNYGRMSANNHLLNTWSMIIFDSLFGNSEFSLRIGSLIAYLFYLLFSAKIALQFKNNFFSVCAFIILNFHPYLIDFFSLARGYAMAMGFMMASIYYTFRYLEDHSIKRIWTLSFFSTLSVLANFSLLNFLLIQNLVLITYILFRPLRSNENNFINKGLHITQLIGACLLTLSFSLPILFKLKNAGALFFGGSRGFSEDTIGYLIESLLYGKSYTALVQALLIPCIGLLLLISFIYLGIKISQKGLYKKAPLTITFLILLGSATFTILQHHFLGNNYLITRTALFFIPLFLLTFLLTLNEFCLKFNTVYRIIILPTLLLILHGSNCINKSYTYEWQNNANIKQIITYLEKKSLIKPWKNSISIGVDLDFGTPIDYYKSTRHLNWLSSPLQDGKESAFHDFYFFKKDISLLSDWSKETIINSYEFNNLFLKNKINYPINSTSQIINAYSEDLNIISNGIEFKNDTVFRNYATCIVLKLSYNTAELPQSKLLFETISDDHNVRKEVFNLADNYINDHVNLGQFLVINHFNRFTNEQYKVSLLKNPKDIFTQIKLEISTIGFINKKTREN